MDRRGTRRCAALITLFAQMALPFAVLHAAPARAPVPTPSPAPVARAVTPPAPASGLIWSDVPNDAGRAVTLAWHASPDDTSAKLTGYYVERSTSPGGPWTIVDSTAKGVTTRDDQTLHRDTDYFYRITTFGPAGRTAALSVTGPVRATSQWINQTRWSVLVFMVLFFGFVLYYMASAQSGRKPFVRKIPGITAIEEAIGRATEMGRSVLFVPGIQDIDQIETVAGLVILENVAKITARYETPITVPVSYPIPFTIAEEMVKSGYLHAGKPDQYDPSSVRFVSPEQFAFVAAITGIMMRDKPAAHIFMGAFYAESLLLAETGFANGAIQVAGTAQVSQLPFFVVACDYTLIGEELFAASAYLSGEPRLVGGLKGADMLKLCIIAAIIVGCVLETFNLHGLTTWMNTQ